MKLPLLPVILRRLTALFWGMYGPAIGFARTAEGNNPFKPYVMIGVAYLIWASLVGVGGMIYTKAPFTFSGAGVTWDSSAAAWERSAH